MLSTAPGSVEGLADDALGTERGVETLLGGDLVHRSSPQDTARPHVGPLGALAEDHEIDLLRPLTHQGGRHARDTAAPVGS